MRGRATPPNVKRSIRKDLREGYSIAETARKRQVSRNVVISVRSAMQAHIPSDAGQEYVRALGDADLSGPIPFEELRPEAAKALNNFEYFRRRYFGHVSRPWQIDAAEKLVTLLGTPRKEFVVINVAPGSGKSTLFTHDIPAWITCRRRSIRGLMGHRAEREARKYTGRLRRSLERRVAIRADEDRAAKGLECDAEATLPDDYGRFRPEGGGGDIWRVNEFVVAQFLEVAIAEKEMTWTAFGRDSTQIGNRYEFVIWDDLVTKNSLRNQEVIEQDREWFVDEGESRVEPGGVFALQGQRLGSYDLYRYALDLAEGDLDEVGDDIEVITEPSDDSPKKYHHIIYRAHDEGKCEGDHRHIAPAWPEGCLLDPIRLPWRELRAIEKNDPRKYRVVYQQEDADPQSVLVPPIWVSGGKGDDGVDHPGCWDNDRGLAEIPKGLTKPWISMATADPSPTRFWAVQWWLYHPETEQRFLLDLLQQVMDAPTFLDYAFSEGVFVGVMESWQKRSVELGAPITHWIVEQNAAQRFLLQYEHVKRWQMKRSVDIIPHDTYRNKSDPEFGVQSIAPHYRYGRIRLPGNLDARIASLKLVNEVTRWPDSYTDDEVMAQWFFEWNLPNLALGNEQDQTEWRPSWMRQPAYA